MPNFDYPRILATGIDPLDLLDIKTPELQRQIGKKRKIECLELEIASTIDELMEINHLSNSGLASKAALRLGLRKQTLALKIAEIRTGRSLPPTKDMKWYKVSKKDREIALDRVSVLLYALKYMETDNLVCELREIYDQFKYPPPKERPYKLKRTRRKD